MRLGNIVFGALGKSEFAVELDMNLVGYAPFAADGVNYFAHLRHRADDNRIIVGASRELNHIS